MLRVLCTSHGGGFGVDIGRRAGSSLLEGIPGGAAHASARPCLVVGVRMRAPILFGGESAAPAP